MSASSSQDSTPVVSLAFLIRQRREALGWSYVELAQQMGELTTGQDIQVLESSRIQMPSWGRLQRLAEVLDLPLENLLGLSLSDEDLSSSI